MSPPAAQTQWYLARDGQQFGPLSDTELAKFVELGHLQPTDLLWREGFPDWRPAMVVFPPRKPAMQRPAPSARQAGPWLRKPPRREARASRRWRVRVRTREPGRAEPRPPRELRRAGGRRPSRQRVETGPGGDRLPCRPRRGRLVRLPRQRKAAEVHADPAIPGARRAARHGDRKERGGPQGHRHLAAQGLQRSTRRARCRRCRRRRFGASSSGSFPIGTPSASRRSPRWPLTTRTMPPSASRWRARWWPCAASRSATRSLPASRS